MQSGKKKKKEQQKNFSRLARVKKKKSKKTKKGEIRAKSDTWYGYKALKRVRLSKILLMALNERVVESEQIVSVSTVVRLVIT